MPSTPISSRPSHLCVLPLPALLTTALTTHLPPPSSHLPPPKQSITLSCNWMAFAFCCISDLTVWDLSRERSVIDHICFRLWIISLKLSSIINEWVSVIVVVLCGCGGLLFACITHDSGDSGDLNTWHIQPRWPIISYLAGAFQVRLIYWTKYLAE